MHALGRSVMRFKLALHAMPTDASHMWHIVMSAAAHSICTLPPQWHRLWYCIAQNTIY